MREVVLGRSARIWQAIAREPGIAERFQHALGHAELASFAFTPEDRVWVFAYSRVPAENSTMLRRLKEAGVAEIVYITSSSTIIAPLTDCYEYPRAKKQAEDEAVALPQARVLTLGLVVEREDELPAGSNAATTIAEIARFMLTPAWPVAQGRRAHLLRIVQRPFHGPLGGAVERALYGLYGAMMSVAGRHPCVLRPVDLVLRVLGMRWYGYTFLSNRLWTQSMTS
ncbi:MAG: hypothetical protein QM742_18190 [Aquabacterium sp.]